MSSTSSPITTRSHHPRMEYTSLPNLSSLFSKLIPTTHGWNTYYWPHIEYIDSDDYVIDPTIERCKKKTLTTYPLCQVLSLYKIQPSHVNAITLTICPVCPVLSPHQTQPPTCGTQHWPHVQYVQSYHYAKSHHPYVERIQLTTCPVRTFLTMIAILDPTTHIWNTQHWPHVHYTQSYCYIRSHHPHMKHTSLTTYPLYTVLSLYYIPPPTYGTHNTDRMSSKYSPIAILYPTTHIRNTQYWPHVQYV